MNRLAYAREIPIKGGYDVVVAGAGASGACAAVSAARAGARVALVERYGVLGGMLTVGHVGPILGMVGKGTLRDELLARLGVPGNDMIGAVGVAHDVEKAKRVMAEFVMDERIDVLLQTSVVDVMMDGATITHLVVSGKEGLYALQGRVFVDATGDGDVAFLAGAVIEKGRDDGLMQPVTLEFTLDQVDESRAVVCIGDVDDVELNEERFLDFCRRAADAGLIPKELAAVRLHRTTKAGERQVNTTQVCGVDATRAGELYRAEVALRGQIEALVEFFRAHLPGYERCKLISSGATLGVRETRRVMGEHVMTAEEMVAGARFADVVVHKAEFIVDIHNPAGAGQAEAHIQCVAPYDLPYRAFVPLTVDALLMTGRSISGTHRAHASYRVMSICMAMGEAVGAAAALCARAGCMPRALDVTKVQALLTGRGVDLFSK